MSDMWTDSHMNCYSSFSENKSKESHKEDKTEVDVISRTRGIEEALEDADKEPLLDEVIDNGNVLVSRAYCDGETDEFVRYQIIKYERSLYYIEHTGAECTAFRKL